MKTRILIPEKFLLLVLLLLFFYGQKELFAQSISHQVVGSTGLVTEVGNMEWTLGELAVIHHHGEAFSLQEGFHQGSQLIMTNISSLFLPELQIFPNPTMDYLQVQHEHSEAIDAQLYDLSGRLLQKSLSLGRAGQIDVSTLRPGIYLLQFTHLGQVLHTAKITKI